ncbi:MAG: hypothetical protein ACRC07_15980 [Pseudomonas paracarnis]
MKINSALIGCAMFFLKILMSKGGAGHFGNAVLKGSLSLDITEIVKVMASKSRNVPVNIFSAG